MKIFDQKFANFLHNLKKIYKNIQQNIKKRYPLNFFLEKIYKNKGGGGRILPMAQKFRDSSNSEEFRTLALLDFSPFVITKP